MKRFAGAALLCFAPCGQTFEVASVKSRRQPAPHEERHAQSLHRETREQTLYDLVVAKSGPKLKKVEFR
jgi:hypothetical protein